MVRKKARIRKGKIQNPWCMRLCHVGCGIWIGFMSVSFILYSIFASNADLAPSECRSQNAKSASTRDAGKQSGTGKKENAQFGQMHSVLPWGNGDLSRKEWNSFVSSLGIPQNPGRVSTLDSDVEPHVSKPKGCRDKCSQIHSLDFSRKEWILFWKAIRLFKMWRRKAKESAALQQANCKFAISFELEKTFARIKNYVHVMDAMNSEDRMKRLPKLAHISLSECRVNVSGHFQRADHVMMAIVHEIYLSKAVENLNMYMSKMSVQCGARTSCLQADIKVQHDTPSSQPGTSRRLLAVPDEDYNPSISLHVTLLSGLSSFLIIFFAILCVCNKKTSTLEDAYAWRSCNRNDDPDILLKQVTPRVDRRSTNMNMEMGTHATVQMNNERHSVHITMEEKRKSAAPLVENGPHQLGHKRNDSRSSARGGTLDRRLPAIPIANPSPPPGQEPSEDEVEVDDTYDTIAPTKIAQNKNDYDTRTDTSDSKTDEGSLRYEPIKMREDVYAEVNDVKKKDMGNHVEQSPSGREGEQTYEFVGKDDAMTLDEKRASLIQMERIKRESPYSRVEGDDSVQSSADGVITHQRPLSQGDSLPRAQSYEVYEMYDTVADESARNSRSFEDQVDAVFAIEEDNYASVDPPPPVPDKQYSPDEVRSQSSGAQSPASPVRTSVVLPLNVGIGPGIALAAPPDPIMSDPPYSQVTARESLASIRERQQRGMAPPVSNDYDMVDNVYEPVDEQPELERTRAESMPVPDAGDWYSEIDCTATAAAAKPPDEDPLPVIIETQSPPPPRGRAFTTGSAPDNIDDLYADIDKSKKTSRNHHEEPVTMATVAEASRSPHYAVVDKSKKKRNRSDDTPPLASPENYTETGARPKLKFVVEQQEELAQRMSLDSSGYQTVDEVKADMERSMEEAELKSPSSNGHLEPVEPGYATVGEEDLDTTYDEIRMESSGASNGEREKMFHMSNHKVADDFWVRREPVYSEVDEDDTPEATIIPVTVL